MNTQLFIPKKCKVGFNIRNDCYTKKLGYVIAHDGKKWRKEASWESWRQKVGGVIHNGGEYVDGKWVEKPKGAYGEEVASIEFDNVPTVGFVLNKKVGGYKSDWNMRQTYARVYDPRGFEFEINIVNLLYILEHSNCMRGKGLEGEFIYSWDGKDLVLLPSESPEFKQATSYTKLQDCKISAKDLVPGCSYKTKKEEDVIYVGKYMWYETSWNEGKGRQGKKYHIFYTDKQKYSWREDSHFILKNDATHLALKNSEEPVSNFADIIDKFKKTPNSSDVIKFELISGAFSDETVKDDNYNGPGLKKYVYFGREGDEIIEFNIQSLNTRENHSEKYTSKGYAVNRMRSFNEKTKLTKQFERYYSSRSTVYYNFYYGKTHDGHTVYQIDDLKKFDFCDLYVTLESGERKKIETLTEL